LVRGEVGGNQVVVIRVNGEVVEPFATRTRKINRGDLSKRLTLRNNAENNANG
jgi:hypothetical protein